MARRIGNASREAEARIADALQLRLAAGAATVYRQVLARDYKALADGYRDAGAIDESRLDKDAMAQAFAINWERTARTFATRMSLATQESKRYQCAIHTKGVLRDLITAELLAYSKRCIAKKITMVSDTTMEQVRGVVDTAEGGTVEDIARSIEGVARTFSAYRAQVIARTETHSLANFANETVADASGIELKKEWGATMDARTREDHMAADGQLVGQGASFNVGGEMLLYPGDTNGSAANIIQCRCQCLYLEA